MAQSAQFVHVRVPNAGLKQRLRQRVAIELWIVPGAWDRPHIHQLLYAVSLEHLDKRLDASGRMPNRQNRRGAGRRPAMRGLCGNFQHLAKPLASRPSVPYGRQPAVFAFMVVRPFLVSGNSSVRMSSSSMPDSLIILCRPFTIPGGRYAARLPSLQVAVRGARVRRRERLDVRNNLNACRELERVFAP